MKTETLVRLTSGEVLAVCGYTDRGIQTDAGTHPWAECEALLMWSVSLGRVVSVPIGQ